jgi:hypothetical protein
MNKPAAFPIPLEIVGRGLDNPTWRRAGLVVKKKKFSAKRLTFG